MNRRYEDEHEPSYRFTNDLIEPSVFIGKRPEAFGFAIREGVIPCRAS
jgi:hypothetical protein